jgi:hypothetical protein
MLTMRLNNTNKIPSLNRLSPSTMVESREGTETSLKTAITETVSVFAKITPANKAGIHANPRLSFNKTTV